MEPKDPSPKKKLNFTWFFTTLVLAIGCIYYSFLLDTKFNNTAALYIGLPLILALGLSLTPKTQSVMGAIMKGITIALILSAIIFREGYICILFAAPIFYFVGGIIGLIVEWFIKRKDKNSTLRAPAFIVSLVALFSLEGVFDLLTLPRYNQISVSKIINANADDVLQKLNSTPHFSQHKPLFLKIFPYPAHIEGEGLDVGSQRVVNFIAYKQIWWNKVEGSLVLRVAQNDSQHIKFDILKDSSYLSHYLKWQNSEVWLDPIDSTHTKVTWTLAYERILDPAWYFGPMQKYAVKLAAKELIDNVATPTQQS